MRNPITIFCLLFSVQIFAQDSLLLKVHFLYGSKPRNEFKSTETKWFGGKWGGHVGIELDSNQIVNFLPRGKFHWVEKPGNKHSVFAIHSYENFYNILGTVEPAKNTIFYIPISRSQKQQFDSITASYLNHTPYDYALIGMRCGAAAYDILSQLGIVKGLSRRATSMKIFYPKKLRKRLLNKARINGWKFTQEKGSETRKWEMD